MRSLKEHKENPGRISTQHFQRSFKSAAEGLPFCLSFDEGFDPNLRNSRHNEKKEDEILSGGLFAWIKKEDWVLGVLLEEGI